MNSVAELVHDIRAGKMVILVDDEERENEGDLVMAADYITPSAVNFMVTEGRGLVCLSLTSEQIHRLELPLMARAEVNRTLNRTAFTVSIEAARGVSTGISAADRALTIKVASNPMAKPSDIVIPGHIFPIKAQDGGVLRRAGHTEASVDLVRLAGLNPAAVICEIMNSDGSMARVSQLEYFAKKHDLKMGTIESLIQHRIETEYFVREIASSPFESDFMQGFRVHLFENELDGKQHLAFVRGQITPEVPVTVRVQTECLLGDVFGSQLFRTREFLEKAFQEMSKVDTAVLLYLRLESLSERLQQSVESRRLETSQLDNLFRSDDRDYGVGAQILRSLGVRKIRLVSHHAAKKVGLRGYGLEIVEVQDDV